MLAFGSCSWFARRRETDDGPGHSKRRLSAAMLVGPSALCHGEAEPRSHGGADVQFLPHGASGELRRSPGSGATEDSASPVDLRAEMGCRAQACLVTHRPPCRCVRWMCLKTACDPLCRMSGALRSDGLAVRNASEIAGALQPVVQPIDDACHHSLQTKNRPCGRSAILSQEGADLGEGAPQLNATYAGLTEELRHTVSSRRRGSISRASVCERRTSRIVPLPISRLSQAFHGPKKFTFRTLFWWGHHVVCA